MAALPGAHAARVAVAAGQDYVDGASAYERHPLTVTADVASGPRRDGVAYRVGARFAAPPPSAASRPAGGAAPPPRVHLQGAVAVEGEAVLWKRAPGQGRRRRAGAAAAPRGSDRDDDHPLPPPPPPAAKRASLERPLPLKQIPRRPPRPGGRLEAVERRAAAVGAASGAAALQALPDLVAADWVVDVGPDGETTVLELMGKGEGLEPAPAPPPPATPSSPPSDASAADILASLDAATRAMGALRRATARVRRVVAAGGVPATPGERRGRAPYAPGVGAPAARVFGAVGVLARIPLPADALAAVGGRRAPPPRRARPPSGGRPPPAPTPTPPAPRRRSPLAALAAALDGDAWAPALAGTALRAFGCAGATLQLGRFARPLLDYTAVSARLDLGLAGGGGAAGDAAAVAAARGGPPAALLSAPPGDAAGSWHALSLSACQQVAGALRARCDVRYALEAAPAREPGPREPGRAISLTPSPLRRPSSASRSKSGAAASAAAAAAWTAARRLRAARLESVVGLDYTLPGTDGALRLCGWWSPGRREAMCEIRLL